MKHLLRIGVTLSDKKLSPLALAKDLKKNGQVRAEFKEEGRHLTMELMSDIRPDVEAILNHLKRDGMEVVSHSLDPAQGSIIGKNPDYKPVQPPHILFTSCLRDEVISKMYARLQRGEEVPDSERINAIQDILAYSAKDWGEDPELQAIYDIAFGKMDPPEEPEDSEQ
jgi:hypothetical protein